MVNAEVLYVDCNDMPITRLIYLYYMVVPVTSYNSYNKQCNGLYVQVIGKLF